MWPFQKNKNKSRSAIASVGDIIASWGQDGWSFSDGQYDYTMYENDVFDCSIVAMLPNIEGWLINLKNEIDTIIDEHVGDWDLETDDRAVVSIDVSRLSQENQIDVAYGCEQWADYGVNVVVTNGAITESYGGD